MFGNIKILVIITHNLSNACIRFKFILPNKKSKKKCLENVLRVFIKMKWAIWTLILDLMVLTASGLIPLKSKSIVKT